MLFNKQKLIILLIIGAFLMFYKTSAKGIEEIKFSEGTVLTAYQDQKGVWTIGVGHTGSKYAYPGSKITKEKAEQLLKEDLKEAEEAVTDLVRVPLGQNQFDSLVSFVFNLGRSRLAKSTLLKKLNKGDYIGAADEFPKWRLVDGKVNKGIIKRRARERAMFLLDIKEEDPLDSNIQPDTLLKQPVLHSKPIQALGATSVAATLAEASERVAPLAEYSEYIRILWIVLVIAGIWYFVKSRKEGDLE